MTEGPAPALPVRASGGLRDGEYYTAAACVHSYYGHIHACRGSTSTSEGRDRHLLGTNGGQDDDAPDQRPDAPKQGSVESTARRVRRAGAQAVELGVAHSRRFRA